MKSILTLIFILFLASFSEAQKLLPDNLQKAFDNSVDDSARFIFSRPIYTFYEETNRDSALHYAQIRYAIAKKNNRRLEEAYTQGQMAYQQIFLGRFSEALTNLSEAMQIATSSSEAPTWELTVYSSPGRNRELTLSMLNHMYGHLKLQTGSTESLQYFKKGAEIGKEINNDFRVTVGDMVLAANYLMLNQPDSALFYAKEGESYGIRGGISKYLAYIWSVMGNIYAKKGLDSLALSYYHKSLHTAIPESNFTVVAGVYENLINFYKRKGDADSVLLYATKFLAVVKSLGAITSFVTGNANLGAAYQNMADAYSLKNERDSTIKYMQVALAIKDSLTATKLSRLSAFQRLTLDEQLSLQNAEKERIREESRLRTFSLIGVIVAAVIIMLIIYRNNRQKQKAYNLLQKQKEETDIQKDKADKALQELKATQAQLIQSEKMASLGELTAGIAHEIQNPLNFVNNFSDVNRELLSELKEEAEKGELEEVKAIANDVIENSEKILHHGKRADAIVRGMLQHSRTSSGQKEPTDINALCDEYLRLSYHGLRAKDKSFNATLKTEFDESAGIINIIPQDIGRVIMNLLTNAFYALNERKQKNSLNYDPVVSISTKKINNSIQIKVTDNGNGIPQYIIDKIFQPFFTTKPTGQGTGLGLSLAYDIVKAHGGEIKVTSIEGTGSEFSIIMHSAG
ncbi:sensor histidine kinase [Pollutibacter soli]|uniref:sensor histidine kinase n=1 Tax=Pollutibacter soli TaxID=3034157 RepID=UPI0030139D5D